MLTVGTISLREETFQALLTDIAHSLKMHGFENIILIGDSGGNQTGMKAVADKLNAQWNGKPVVAHIPEYYDYNTGARSCCADLGVTKEGQPSDGLHDDPGITLNMFITDPKSVRWDAARQGRQGDHQRRLDRRQGEDARARRRRSSTCAPRNTVGGDQEGDREQGQDGLQDE